MSIELVKAYTVTCERDPEHQVHIFAHDTDDVFEQLKAGGWRTMDQICPVCLDEPKTCQDLDQHE